MKLSNQVTSLELSRRLKELGVKQDSLFYWIIDSEGKEINIAWHKELIVFAKRDDARGISAFTVSELGEMFPSHIGGAYLSLDKYDSFWQTQYGGDYNTVDDNYFTEHGDTLANSMAQMLIHLIENKLIKL